MLAAGILLIVLLTVSEYRPADVEPVPVSGKAEEKQIPMERKPVSSAIDEVYTGKLSIK